MLATQREWLALQDGRTIAGVIAARPRFGTDTWDIARLEIAPQAEVSRATYALLEALCQRAVAEGVEKLYLRLRQDSAATGAARRAGLFAYAQEFVCAAPDGGASVARAVIDDVALAGLRPRRPSDHQALFQLYSSSVPLAVRQVEAMTLREWRWLDGWNAHARLSRRGRSRQDFVVAREGSVVGWLRICPGTRHIELSGRDGTLGRALVAFGLDRLGPGGPVSLVLRDYQRAMLPIPDELGFELLTRNWLLVRVFTIRATDSFLVPVGAS